MGEPTANEGTAGTAPGGDGEDTPSTGPGDGLPPAVADLVRPDEAEVVGLYNALQDMDGAAAREVFEGSLGTLQAVVDADEPELATVLGLDLDGERVTDATLLSVHVLGGDRVLHAAPDAPVPDAAVYVPVRPEDFPPGSGQTLAELDAEGYHEVVASMVFVRHQLYDESPEALDPRYRRPLRRGLAAYARR